VLLRHQASLDVTSELGSGSTFTVLLPARRVSPEPLPDPRRSDLLDYQ
jgi:signal transduction histidine kinase